MIKRKVLVKEEPTGVKKNKSGLTGTMAYDKATRGGRTANKPLVMAHKKTITRVQKKG